VSLNFNVKAVEIVEPMRVEVRKDTGEVSGATEVKLRENSFKRGEGIKQEVMLVISKGVETGGYQIWVEVGGARKMGQFSVKVVPRGMVDSYHTVFVVEYLRHAHRAPLF
jgi:hypothetical protein